MSGKCLNFNELLRRFVFGLWIQELFRNVVINYQITNLSVIFHSNEFFKKRKKILVKLTQKWLGQRVRQCKFTDNKNKSRRKNLGVENSLYSRNTDFCNWMARGGGVRIHWLKTRVVCPRVWDRRHPGIPPIRCTDSRWFTKR